MTGHEVLLIPALGQQSQNSLIGINFDRNALLNLFHQARGYFVADVDEIRPQYQDAPDANALFTSSIVRDTGLSVGATVNQLDTQVSPTSTG